METLFGSIRSLLDKTDERADQGLSLAVQYPNVDMETVEFHLNAGANVNKKDRNGKTPLHYTVLTCRVDIAKHLLDRGAEVDSRDGDGNTPLDLVLSLEESIRYKPIITLLSDRKASIPVPPELGGTKRERPGM